METLVEHRALNTPCLQRRISMITIDAAATVLQNGSDQIMQGTDNQEGCQGGGKLRHGTENKNG